MEINWDAPTYDAATLQKLQLLRSLTKSDIENAQRAQTVVYDEEVLLREQLRQLTAKRMALKQTEEEKRAKYAHYSSIESRFADEMAKQAAIADLNGKISALETKLASIAGDRNFWSDIMPFQKEDLLYLVNAWDMGFTGVLNANDTGLGKTVETIAFDFLACEIFREKHGTEPSRIWLTKRSLVKSTCREFKKWFPDVKVMPLLSGTPEQRDFIVNTARSMGALLVANYDAVDTTPALVNQHWNFIYADEVHRLKGGANPKPTKLWCATRDLIFTSRAKGNSFFLPLSGSPVQNHPKDMWAYLHLFDPIRFESVRKFERDYCSWYNAGIRIAPDLLIKAMKSQIIRRTKKEVNDQLKLALVDPIFDERWVEMLTEQRKVYDQMKKEFFVWLDEQEGTVLTAAVIIARLNRLRQFALWPDAIVERPVGSAKIDEAMDIIEELTNEGEQVVVFSAQFNEPLMEIKRRCESFYDLKTELIVGANKDVDQSCENFRQGTSKVICINMASGAEGLNLQKSTEWPGGACHAIFLDLWWNPEKNRQAQDRINRTGQLEQCTFHIIKAEQSVDIYIDVILAEKSSMITQLMEDKQLRKTDLRDSLKELL